MKENLLGEPELARRSQGDSLEQRLQRSTAAQPGRKVRHRKAAHPLRHYGNNVKFATTCSPISPASGLVRCTTPVGLTIHRAAVLHAITARAVSLGCPSRRGTRP